MLEDWKYDRWLDDYQRLLSVPPLRVQILPFSEPTVFDSDDLNDLKASLQLGEPRGVQARVQYIDEPATPSTRLVG